MKTTFEMPIPLEHYQKSESPRVIVLGCGGTGGYLVPNLARLLASLDRGIELILIDGDHVEPKNLIRQNFIDADLGRNKAEVLSERYGGAFGHPIQFMTEYLKDAEALEKLTVNIETIGSTIVIGCVDNHRTRREIAKWFRKAKGRIWIDAGNEEMNGQVICGYSHNPHNSNKSEPFALPCIADLFPEVDTDQTAQFNDELSCADRAISAPQNIATNLLAANYLLTFTQQMILGNPLRSHGVFFSSERSSTDSLFNVRSRINPQKWPGYSWPFRRHSWKTDRKAQRKSLLRKVVEERKQAA